MTKEEIIKIIIIALIGSFSKSLFDNILGKYIPDKKKLNSYILKFLLFSLRYILPIYFLITAFLSPNPIDKTFVFKVSIFTLVIFLNLVIDIFSIYHSKYQSLMSNITEAIRELNKILKVLDNTDNKIIDRIEEINEKVSLSDKKKEK